VVIDDYQDVPSQSESSLLKAVTKNPVSVAIEASGRDFQHYQGVCNCKTHFVIFLLGLELIFEKAVDCHR
jgi:hypothetical protein